MDDREMVTAIAAEDQTGIAAAYDKYAEPLYGYCQWLLTHPVLAAEALRSTFVVASATIDDLAEDSKLRPWLYALARKQCRHLGFTEPAPEPRKGAAVMWAAAAGSVVDMTMPVRDTAPAPDATMQFRAARPAADTPPAPDATMQFRAARP